LDVWLAKNYPKVVMVRYADDVIVHCQSEKEALQTMEAIRNRMEECKLRLNEQKTQIVYSKNSSRKLKNNYRKKFDFLGFTFKPMLFPNKQGGAFLGIGCVISQKSMTRIVKGWKKMNFHLRTTDTIQNI
ncbi:MAG: reverse transcriptase domain-containing protein, partial [Dolichospermum sp.]